MHVHACMRGQSQHTCSYFKPAPAARSCLPDTAPIHAPLLQGHSYRGTRSMTRSGYTCQRWDATEPVFHNRIPSAFPDAGLVDNYCRNPDNEPEVWCYTIDGPRWEHCGVPLCGAAAPDPAAAPAAAGGGAGAAVAATGVEQTDASVEEQADAVEPGAEPGSGSGDDDDTRTAMLAGAPVAAGSARCGLLLIWLRVRVSAGGLYGPTMPCHPCVASPVFHSAERFVAAPRACRIHACVACVCTARVARAPRRHRGSSFRPPWSVHVVQSDGLDACMTAMRVVQAC